MDYIEVNFTLLPNEEYVQDILSAALGEAGFESFVATGSGLTAFCPATLFSEETLQDTVSNFPLDAKITYTRQLVKAQNWNEEWEKHYFEPIIIGNECIIHSSFHQNIPQLKYNILIDPRMSFGTGHHETTSLMLEYLLQTDVAQKSFLDMGCGTAVLAILAAMKGAKPVMGIDIDEWAYSNSLDNLRLNRCPEIDIRQGGAELLDGLHFDIIFANINRNILLNDMQSYAKTLADGGELYMSGFYREDIAVIEQKAATLGLRSVSFLEKNNWAAIRMRRI